MTAPSLSDAFGHELIAMSLSRRSFLTQSSLLALFPAWSAACSSAEGGAGTPAGSASASTNPLRAQDFLFNQRILDRNPAKVSSDLLELLREAVSSGKPLRPLAGGHGYLGSASVRDGLVLDMRPYRQVTFDKAQHQVTVQAGTRFIDFYRALMNDDPSIPYVLPTGDCPTVGMAGYTLGGGYGHFSRRFGLMCDNIVGLTALVVNRSGVVEERKLSLASTGDDADLFWALRGAGSARFAVINDFTFQMHPRPRDVRIYDIRLRGDLSANELEKAIQIWADWLAPRMADPTTSSKLALGSGWFHISGFVADASTARALVDQLAPYRPNDAPPWDLDFAINNLAVAFKQCDNLDACELQPKRPFAGRSAFLSQRAIRGRFRAMAETVIARRATPEYGGIELMAWRMKGGIDGNNAFVHRDHDFLCQFYTEGMGDESAPWMQAIFRATTGQDDNDENLPGYPNYTDARIAGSETGFPKAYYPGTTANGQAVTERLAAIQRRYRSIFG